MRGLAFIRLSPRMVRRAAVIATGLLSLFTFVVILLCGRLGIHSRGDVMDYQTLIEGHYHPVWKALAWRSIRKGDPVEKVLKKHPPLRQEDFPPYTALRYHEINASDRLIIWAKDGKLMSAAADDDDWTRFFFDSPEEQEAFNNASSAYAQQRTLETQAFAIHQTIQAGQDVFLARVIKSHDDEYDADMMEELRAIYGQEYLQALGMVLELTVEVTTTLHGNLQVGAVLTFPLRDYHRPKAGEPEPVFLHVDDARLLNPQNKARENYSTVPQEALNWYRNLTPEQVSDLEARSLTRWTERWQPEKPLTRHPPKSKPKPPQYEPRSGLRL